MGGRVTVHFACSPLSAFEYLSDPRNRPQWQSSLRAVEPLSEPADGPEARWIDVTWPGLRPVLETTVYEPGVRWCEDGDWHGLRATLELTFAASGDGTEVSAWTTLSGSGWRRPVSWAAQRLAPWAVASDLRRAAAICANAEAGS